MLEVRHIRTGYQKTEIIHDVSFEVSRGEFLCIVGPNGCGKTTLLRAVAGILPYQGEVCYDGTSVARLSRLEIAQKAAFLTQMSEVTFPYTVRETVLLGRYSHRKGLLSGYSKDDYRITDETLERLDLTSVADRMINQLSGGQLQRVFLARAVVQQPQLILLDEPTNHLDLSFQLQFLDYLRDWMKESGRAVLGVLHDVNLVRSYADRVLLLQNGEALACGPAAEMLTGDRLQTLYGIDVRRWMLDSLKKWEDGNKE